MRISSVSGIDFLDTSARQADLLASAGQRSWPLPDRPWAQAETREQLTLAHWPVPAGELLRFLPPELRPELFAGSAWLGAVGFRTRNLRARGLPPLPGLSSLLELELRTYVSDGSRAGIWLFSLELSHRLLAEAAKRLQRLPAYHAELELEANGAALALEARRDGQVFRARYTPVGPGPAAPLPGSLDAFVGEQAALYTADGGRLYRAELLHSPLLLRAAQAQVDESSLLPLELPAAPEARLAASQDLLMWPMEEM